MRAEAATSTFELVIIATVHCQPIFIISAWHRPTPQEICSNGIHRVAHKSVQWTFCYFSAKFASMLVKINSLRLVVTLVHLLDALLTTMTWLCHVLGPRIMVRTVSATRHPRFGTCCHLISKTVMLVANSSSRALWLGTLCKPNHKRRLWELCLSGALQILDLIDWLKIAPIVYFTDMSQAVKIQLVGLYFKNENLIVICNVQSKLLFSMVSNVLT